MTPEEYWNHNVQRLDQKFYTAFCLLTAACSDYAVGIDLRNEGKLTWAATALYYSLVHCGRLACFIAFGDFPIGHLQLQKLFQQGQTDCKTWMQEFRGFLETEEEIQPQRRFSRAGLVTSYRNLPPSPMCTTALFQEWGQLFSKAKNLRNDSSYEGLLIAHEYNHVKVTEALHNLVLVFTSACESVLPQAIARMKGFVDSTERRKYWFAFLNWEERREGLFYLEDSLLTRINNERTRVNVAGFLSQLRQRSDQHLDLAIEVGEHVKIGVFGGKARLMDDFQHKIREMEMELKPK